jgi:hypothetical protein
MSITNYSELQTAVTNWMARADLSGDAAEFIALAEARLNREIPAVETDATLTGTLDSRRIDISSNNCVEAIALFLAEADTDEVPLLRKADGTFPYLDASGKPRIWSIDGENIDFDRPLDAAYPFRFRFRQKFALSGSATTNWLLTNHPDIYLAATLIWGGVFIKDTPYAALFSGALDKGISDVVNLLAQKNRGILTVDPALLSPGRYDFATDTSS